MLEAIRDRIRAEGPIDLATYMAIALYGPGGFYEDPPIGADGDFVTSPHVHPAFGVFVARALAEMAAALPGEMPLRVLEVGAGDGTLARQVLAEGLGQPATYTAVEVSAGARAALQRTPGVSVAERETDADLVLAHELLDNLPFRLLRDGREVRVDVDGDGLIERLVPADDELRALIGDVPADGELVVPVGAIAFVDRIAAHLGRGYALLIDYGSEGSGGPVHGYREQHPIEDILAAPGETDITAGVDFGWIRRCATEAGLTAFDTVSQHRALIALGLEEWLRAGLDEQREHLDAGRGLDAVRTWSGRSRATMLADPASLGRLRWCVLATPGLPAPPWLSDASRSRR